MIYDPLQIRTAQGAVQTLVGKQCVQAWLGYNEVLFFGLGNNLEAFKERARAENSDYPLCFPHVHPPFEISTNYGDWAITCDGKTVSECTYWPEGDPRGETDEPADEEALQQIVGRECLTASVDDRGILALTFTGGYTLRITPWTATETAEPSDSTAEPWSLRIEEYGDDGNAVVRVKLTAV
jgi:hypothetical protein